MTEEKHDCKTKPDEFVIIGYKGAVFIMLVLPVSYEIEISYCPFCGKNLHDRC